MSGSNSFLYRFRLAQFQKILRKRIAGQVAKKLPVHELKVNQIGILFDATDMESKNEVIRFAQLIQRLNIRVNLLAFTDHTERIPSLPFRHFIPKDCSFYFIPENSDINTFLDFPYDVVINADLKQNLSLHYVTAICQAPLKVGPQSIMDEYYHLILDTKDTFTIKQYISELISILNKVCFHGRLAT